MREIIVKSSFVTPAASGTRPPLLLVGDTARGAQCVVEGHAARRADRVGGGDDRAVRSQHQYRGLRLAAVAAGRLWRVHHAVARANLATGVVEEGDALQAVPRLQLGQPLRRIVGDDYPARALLGEVIESFLQALQVAVADASPLAADPGQDQRAIRLIAQPPLVAAEVAQRELRRRLAHSQHPGLPSHAYDPP